MFFVLFEVKFIHLAGTLDEICIWQTFKMLCVVGKTVTHTSNLDANYCEICL